MTERVWLMIATAFAVTCVIVLARCVSQMGIMLARQERFLKAMAEIVSAEQKIADEFAADELEFEKLEADHKAAIESLKAQGADPVALAELESIHQKFAAAFTASTGTSTPSA